MTTYHLNDHSLLKITGNDAGKFLQGQLTYDVTQLGDKAHLAAHCDRKGRVQSLFRIFKYDDSFYLIMPSNILDSTIAVLKKYAVFSKVSLTPLSLSCYACDDDLTYPDLVKIEIANRTDSYLIDMNNTFNQTSQPAALWHIKELEAGVARLYPNTIGVFLPHDLNLPALQAVSFNKGCYTGQEIVARMQYRGKLKAQLNLKKFPVDSRLEPNMELADKQGIVVDCVVHSNEMSALVLSS